MVIIGRPSGTKMHKVCRTDLGSDGTFVSHVRKGLNTTSQSRFEANTYGLKALRRAEQSQMRGSHLAVVKNQSAAFENNHRAERENCQFTVLYIFSHTFHFSLLQPSKTGLNIPDQPG